MAGVVTGDAVVLDVPPAQFPSRLVALLIDMAVQITTAIVLLAIIAAASSRLNAASGAAIVLTTLVLIIVGYPAVFETLSRGRSLGKMALGLRVVSDDGAPERFRQALVRALASVVEIWAFTGAPALICSLLSPQGKRLGDLFAGTFVIQERLPRRPNLPAALAVVPPPLAEWAQTLELSGLRDQTAEQASSYLRRLHELTPAARDEFGHQIAAAVAAQVTPPPPPGTPPAAFLSAVLAVRRQRETARLAAQQNSAASLQPGSSGPQGPAAAPGAGVRHNGTPGAGLAVPAPPGQAPADQQPSGPGDFAPPS
jgi:uncharacterized RDD family membrane protein YckC